MVEEIRISGKLIALIIQSDALKEGVEFFTSSEMEQQAAKMKYKSGYSILPHTHNEVKREIRTTSEVLVIIKGKLRVDFYNLNQYFESRIVKSGDLVLLFGGSHGFKVIEDIEMIEVKQGPFLGEKDKVRFSGVDESKVIIKEYDKNSGL